MVFSSILAGRDPLGHDGADGVDDLGPAAVVEGHGHDHPAVVPGELDRLVHAPEHPPGHPPVAAPGEADLDSLLVELVAPAHEQRLVEPHEVAHLVGRAAPVLGREGVEGDPLDADLEGAVHHIEQSGLARGVPLRPRQPARARPATVPIHDTGDVGGDAGPVELGRDGIRPPGRARPRLRAGAASPCPGPRAAPAPPGFDTAEATRRSYPRSIGAPPRARDMRPSACSC